MGRVVFKINRVSILFQLFFLLLFFTSCASNPVTGKRELSIFSESFEINMGEKNYFMMQQAQGGEYIADLRVAKYVSSIGQRLAEFSDRPHLPYEFVVLNHSVPNAWALPGGKIAVNRGLLLELENEAELAAVLGHEIVHVAAKHSLKHLQQGMIFQFGLAGLGVLIEENEYKNLIGGGSQVLAILLTKKYSRFHELEADLYGMNYMEKAGYDPKAAVTLQEMFVRLKKEKSNSDWFSGILATHPPSLERVRANRNTAEKMALSGFLGVKEYQNVIEPLKKTKKAYEAYDQGMEALQSNRREEAKALAEKALKIEPKEALFYNLLGKVYAIEKQYTTALQAFDRAIEKNSQYYDFFLSRGLLKSRMNDDFAAQEDLKKSLALLSTAQAHYALGQILLRKNHSREALEHFKQASQSDSVEGKKARKELVKIDLLQNPEKYLHVKSAIDTQGNILVFVKNQSLIGVKDLLIEVIDKRKSFFGGRKFIHFYDEIRSGEEVSKRMDLGNFLDNKEFLKTTIHMHIHRVSLME